MCGEGRISIGTIHVAGQEALCAEKVYFVFAELIHVLSEFHFHFLERA